MQVPTFLGWVAVFLLFFFFFFDVAEIGTAKINVSEDTKFSAQTAMVRSVEEDGIRVKRRPRLDVNMFQKEWAQAVMLNAGNHAVAGVNGTSIYRVDRLNPYSATQMQFPVESYFLRYINQDGKGFKQHRMIFIWDEKH